MERRNNMLSMEWNLDDTEIVIGGKLLKIRKATANDANDLFELNLLFGNTTTVELMKENLTENKFEIVCIAYVDNIAVGYCSGHIVKSMCYSEPRADIEALYVREEYRGQGIGKSLILFLEKAFTERGIYHFHNSTYSDNTNALALYESIGYIKYGEILLEKSISV